MARNARFGPWMELAGVFTAVAGLALVVASQVNSGPPLAWTALAIVGGAMVELAAGVDLKRRGGAWMAHVFSGGLVSVFAVYLLSRLLLDPRMVSTPPIALMLGVFCLVNAVFRSLDLLIDGPPAAVSEALDVGVTFVVGVLLVALWRSATPQFLGLMAGVELIAGGASLIGTARALLVHPEQPAYNDSPEEFGLR